MVISSLSIQYFTNTDFGLETYLLAFAWLLVENTFNSIDVVNIKIEYEKRISKILTQHKEWVDDSRESLGKVLEELKKVK